MQPPPHKKCELPAGEPIHYQKFGLLSMLLTLQIPSSFNHSEFVLQISTLCESLLKMLQVVVSSFFLEVHTMVDLHTFPCCSLHSSSCVKMWTSTFKHEGSFGIKLFLPPKMWILCSSTMKRHKSAIEYPCHG